VSCRAARARAAPEMSACAHSACPPHGTIHDMTCTPSVRRLLASENLWEALEAIRKNVDAIYRRFATVPKRPRSKAPAKGARPSKGGRARAAPGSSSDAAVKDAAAARIQALFRGRSSRKMVKQKFNFQKRDNSGVSLKSFVELCDMAELIGPSLSRVSVKAIFLASLELTAESARGRRPLLSRGELDEALLRLCLAYEPSKVEHSAMAGTGGRHTPAKSKLGKAGQARVAELAQSVAGLRPTDAERESDEQAHEREALEGTIYDRLPIVCGRLFGSFEENYKTSGAKQITPRRAK
jgi:hypothetical protein